MGGAFLMYPQCPFLVFCRFLKKQRKVTVHLFYLKNMKCLQNSI